MPPTEPLIRIEYAEIEVVRFKEDLDWKQQHDELVADCWFWEDMSAKASRLFLQITGLEPVIRKFAAQCDRERGHEFYARNRRTLKHWLELASRVRTEMDRLENEYGEAIGAEELRRFVEQAAQKLNAPRPVMIDEQTGEIYESTGEPFLFAGVSQQEVLRALEDERAGRMSSLKEIIAARAR